MNNYNGYIEEMMRAPAIGFSNHYQKNKQRACTILLVEDDWDDYFFAKDSCENSELVKDVILMPNGEELLYYLKDHGFYDHSIIRYNPLLIVLDLQMPKMNGYDVLKELKSDPFLKEVPVIVLSTLDHDQPIAKAFDHGADGYLTKPLNMRKLEKFIPQGWQWPPQEMW